MASTSIQRSRTAGSTKTKFTLSMWFKRSAINAKYLAVNYASDSNRALIQFGGADNLIFQSKYSNSNNAQIETNRKFRDTSAWYHIVLTGDSTLATAADRTKLYVNGVRETSFSAETQISQNGDYYFNEATTNGFRIGEKGDGSDYFDGLMSHVHFTDGYAYQASTFGSTDSTTGEWKINTSPSVTYGTNGFFLKMENGTNMDLDSSSNNLTFSTNGTLTKTEDCPSNVFATLNPLDGNLGNSTFTYGNTRFNSGTNSNVTYATSTLGMVSGKFYFEAKLETAADHNYIGIADLPSPSTSHYFGNTAYEYGYKSSSGEKKNNNTTTSYGNTYTTNDIVMCAVDLDNLKVYFGKNGTWQNSGDPTSGSTGTGAAYTITAPSSTTGGQYFFCVADGTTTNYSRWQTNFGNGYFGTTEITTNTGTGYQDADGNGRFYYAVPTNYRCLSTKGLNQ